MKKYFLGLYSFRKFLIIMVERMVAVRQAWFWSST